MKAFGPPTTQKEVLASTRSRRPSEPSEPSPRADRLELDAVYREHVAAVSRWASRLGGPGADLEDLVHEVFLVVERKLPSFRHEAKLSTWLYQITVNIVRQYRRKARIRRWLAGDAEDVGGDLPSMYPSPIEELERRQARALVYRALDSMGEKYRTVFILFEIEGLSGQEIAEITEVKLNVVWVRLHRARQQFEERVRALEGAP